MEARLEAIENGGDVAHLMRDIGARARVAARGLANAPGEQKAKALHAAAAAMHARSKEILKANAEDIDGARRENATPAFIDRLMLDEKRVAAIADGIRS